MLRALGGVPDVASAYCQMLSACSGAHALIGLGLLGESCVQELQRRGSYVAAAADQGLAGDDAGGRGMSFAEAATKLAGAIKHGGCCLRAVLSGDRIKGMGMMDVPMGVFEGMGTILAKAMPDAAGGAAPYHAGAVVPIALLAAHGHATQARLLAVQSLGPAAQEVLVPGAAPQPAAAAVPIEQVAAAAQPAPAAPAAQAGAAPHNTAAAAPALLVPAAAVIAAGAGPNSPARRGHDAPKPTGHKPATAANDAAGAARPQTARGKQKRAHSTPSARQTGAAEVAAAAAAEAAAAAADDAQASDGGAPPSSGKRARRGRSAGVHGGAADTDEAEPAVGQASIDDTLGGGDDNGAEDSESGDVADSIVVAAAAAGPAAGSAPGPLGAGASGLGSGRKAALGRPDYKLDVETAILEAQALGTTCEDAAEPDVALGLLRLQQGLTPCPVTFHEEIFTTGAEADARTIRHAIERLLSQSCTVKVSECKGRGPIALKGKPSAPSLIIYANHPKAKIYVATASATDLLVSGTCSELCAGHG
jgi:hypothetical protein